VLIDSSSAILLYKTGLMDACGRAYTLVISRSVMNELIVPGHEGAEYFARFISEGSMIVSHEYRGCLLDLPLAGGERDIVLLYLSGQGEFIIIDDGQGAAYCRANHIPYINALLIPLALEYAGKIASGSSRHCLKALLDLGRYSREVKEYAAHCTAKMLESFMP